MTTGLIFLGAITLYAGFILWYRGAHNPLIPREVEAAIAIMGSHEDEVRKQELRDFLMNDDGRDFVMINLIQYREKPLVIAGTESGRSSRATMDRYMRFMWPQLLRRACHPLIGGGAAAAALDLWGIDDDAREWGSIGLMRYRSRRDLVAIATQPRFRDSHLFKQAAIEKTIAFPVAPFFVFAGPQLLVPLALFGVAAGLSLLVG